MNERDVMQRMLDASTLAVVGLSDNPTRPSYYVSAYLQSVGKRILPVNPAIPKVLGVKCYGSLRDLPLKPQVVNVFRLPGAIPAVVEEMIDLGLTDLWVQSGIVNAEAAAKAEAHGIAVVMDRCMMVEHRHRMRGA